MTHGSFTVDFLSCRAWGTQVENATTRRRERETAAPAIPDKRSRIIERAIIMFNEIGYERVRVSDITDSLSIGKGTFYLYFENKKDLLLHCFRRMGELVLELESLSQVHGDYFGKVAPRVEAVDQYEWFPGLINLLRVSTMSPDPEIRDQAREAYEAIAYPLKRDLERAIEQGTARDVDAELAAFAFIGMAENAYFRSRFGDETYTQADVVAFMVDVTDRWLSARTDARDAASQARDYGVTLTTGDGNSLAVESVRFNGETHLRAHLGAAEVDVNRSRLTSFALGHDGDWYVDLALTNGSTMRLMVDPAIQVSGEAAFGMARIALRDLRRVDFASGASA